MNKSSSFKVYKLGDFNYSFDFTLGAVPIDRAEAIRLLATLFKPGDLVFDVGACQGEKSQRFLDAGAGKVVCFEPNPGNLEGFLKPELGSNPRVVIEPCALGSEETTHEFFPSPHGIGLGTCFRDWTVNSPIASRGDKWHPPIEVTMSTLDKMIEKHGLPQFCKIDVEGFELQVLSGLHYKIPYLCFECIGSHWERHLKCIDHLLSLGYDGFNYSPVDGIYFSPEWLTFAAFKQKMEELDSNMDFGPSNGRTGDFYVKHSTVS